MAGERKGGRGDGGRQGGRGEKGEEWSQRLGLGKEGAEAVEREEGEERRGEERPTKRWTLDEQPTN